MWWRMFWLMLETALMSESLSWYRGGEKIDLKQESGMKPPME